MTEVTIVTVQSPIGPLALATRAGVVTHLDLEGRADELATRLKGRVLGETDPGRRLQAYFDGDLRALDAISVEPEGTPFQREVWAALRTIPAGQVWSYRRLAEAVGRAKASRAVGAANGANPIALIIPCHRVIASDGTLGGYGGGLDRKAWLLRHEGANLL